MTIPAERNIRILLVDEQVIVRTGLRLLLESHPGFVVVGEAANFMEAAAATYDSPDIILLDLKSFSHQASIETLPALMKSVGKARILLLTDENDPEGSLNAVRLGAMGFIKMRL
jgi:two-component system response regulator NreC